MTIEPAYCVYHTTYLGDKMPPNYIGSSSIKKVMDGYHGSVKSKLYGNIWKNELAKNPHLFNTVIISTHHTRREAFYKELLIQKIFNVVKSDLFINMSLAKEDGYFGMDQSGENHPHAKYYKLISPNKQIFVIKNLTKFCDDIKHIYNIDRKTISSLATNNLKTYKGWKCFHCDENGFAKDEFNMNMLQNQ